MRDLPKLSTYLVKFSVGVLIGATAFWALVHLWLRIPLHSLVMPWVLYSALGALAGPLVWWSLKHEASSGGDRRAFFVTISAVCVLGSWLLAYYARKFGLVSPNYFRGLCISVLVAIGPGMVVGYYLAERVYPSPHRRHSSSGNEPAKST